MLIEPRRESFSCTFKDHFASLDHRLDGRHQVGYAPSFAPTREYPAAHPDPSPKHGPPLQDPIPAGSSGVQGPNHRIQDPQSRRLALAKLLGLPETPGSLRPVQNPPGRLQKHPPSPVPNSLPTNPQANKALHTGSNRPKSKPFCSNPCQQAIGQDVASWWRDPD